MLLLLASSAYANHGPGTSGGGSSTISGEVLKPGKFSLDLRMDYTEFEHVSRAEAERRALESGGFDAAERRSIGERVRTGDAPGTHRGDVDLDPERVAAALETMAQLLGLVGARP